MPSWPKQWNSAQSKSKVLFSSQLLYAAFRLFPMVSVSSPGHHLVLAGDGDPCRLQYTFTKFRREAQTVHHEVCRQAELLAHEIGWRAAVIHLLVLERAGFSSQHVTL